jgi:hypothetical protein
MKMVRDIWTNTVVGSTPMERWQGKIRRLRQYLRGWVKNISSHYKKEKKEIVDTLDGLDKKTQHTLLQEEETNINQCLKNRLTQLLREEEIKWYQ